MACFMGLQTRRADTLNIMILSCVRFALLNLGKCKSFINYIPALLLDDWVLQISIFKVAA
jgi:hypothetical protein